MENNNIKENNLLKIIKGSIISIICSIFLLILYALILTYTNVSESTIVPVTIIITCFSIFLGSFIVAGKIQKNVLINGGLVGLIYVLFIYLLSSLMLYGFSLNINSIIMLVCSIIFGMLGGVLGVNLRK